MSKFLGRFENELPAFQGVALILHDQTALVELMQDRIGVDLHSAFYTMGLAKVNEFPCGWNAKIIAFKRS